MKTRLGPHIDDLGIALGDRDQRIKLPDLDTKPPHSIPMEGVLHQIEAALSRLDLGTYGLCQRCGEEISLGRLKANPIETQCGTCLKT